VDIFNDMMPLHPSWTDIAVRLLVTVIAGGLIGLNRQAGGHSAGLRTTVLVGLAACLAMIQANILLSLSGRTDESFVRTDVFRFPLGVLTGVGFIGGGAILKRGDLVTGVTTAATMWVMTAIGLCIGGGQILVGCLATVLVLFVLAPLKYVDQLMRHEQKGRVVVESRDSDVPDLKTLLDGVAEVRFTGKRQIEQGLAAYSYELRWKAKGYQSEAGDILAVIEKRHKVASLEVGDETD
jgi:putative Mg2+ transporter-C (MgtC) family protein